MSTSLIVVLSVVLLGIVPTFCFVGCRFDTSGLPGTPFTSYTNTTVGNPLCIGCWPLKEKFDTDDAVDLISGNNGKYNDPTTAPTLYPWPAYSVPGGTGPAQPGVYRWVGIIGNGDAAIKGFTTVVGDEIVLGRAGAPAKPVYLAMTYDATNQTLTLFVNGGVDGVGVQVPGVAYMPNATQPLWIGAGASYVPRRPQPAGTLGSPLFPFVGAIQDVAIWRDMLSPADINTRFNNGSGTS
jgi:hypothetical protein